MLLNDSGVNKFMKTNNKLSSSTLLYNVYVSLLSLVIIKICSDLFGS